MTTYALLMGSPSDEMTVPRQTRDLLMFPPSFSLSPSAPVALARSLHTHKKGCTPPQWQINTIQPSCSQISISPCHHVNNCSPLIPLTYARVYTHHNPIIHINRIYSPDTLCSYKTSNCHHNISKRSYCNVALLTCTHHTQASLSQTHAHPSTHILTQTLHTAHTHTHTHTSLPHIIIYSLPSS